MALTIDPRGSVLSSAVTSALKSGASTGADGASFGDALKRALNDVSDLQGESKELIGAFLRGEPVELHQVMISAEQTDISFRVAMAIRDKLVEAYQETMRMSV